jgi:glycosyltransferase involved in cell wall biosynthesis
MRIVHIISGLSIGGAEMMLYRLIQSSKGDGVTHTVISMSATDMIGDKIRALGVDVRILDMSRGVPNPLLLTRLVRWLVELRPDVVQTWMYHADLFGGIAALVARKVISLRDRAAPRLMLAWGVHQTEYPTIGNYKKLGTVAKSCALLSRHVPDAIICCANAAKTTHAKGGYSEDRMEVIFNGFDLELFRPRVEGEDVLRAQLGIRAEAPIIGIVGRVDPAKDYENFVAAIGKTARQYPDCHYVMIGKGLDESNVRMRTLIEQAGVKGTYHLLGARHDLHLLIPSFDIFCLSSRSEGLPTVVGEAMAAGVPCVATDVGDTAALVGDTGQLVPRENADALAAGLIHLLGLPRENRQYLGQKARERIQAGFSIGMSWQRYKRVYRSFINGTSNENSVAY